MQDEFDKENEKLFTENYLEDSKINRVIERNLFRQLETCFSYAFAKDVDKKETERNFAKKYGLIQTLSERIINEIEDNLLLLTKEKGKIYLQKLHDKTTKHLEKLQQNILEYKGIDFKEIDKLGHSNNLTRDEFVLYSIQSINFIEKRIVDSLIEFLEGNLKYYSTNIDIQNSKKTNQLTANQIVLIFQEIGFFIHPKIEDASKVKQAKLISKIVGIHEKTIKTNIEKLDKNPLSNGDNYQKDIDKINTVLDGLV